MADKQRWVDQVLVEETQTSQRWVDQVLVEETVAAAAPSAGNLLFSHPNKTGGDI